MFANRTKNGFRSIRITKQNKISNTKIFETQLVIGWFRMREDAALYPKLVFRSFVVMRLSFVVDPDVVVLLVS